MATEYVPLEAVSGVIAETCAECVNACLEFDGIFADFEQCMINGIKKKLDSVPAANVRPVVRGEWLKGNDNPRTYGRIRAMCGRCGAFALYEMVNVGSYKEKLSNLCPNCGADMREGTK